ncbi:MAG: hypothetical protein ABL974_13820 [Prosthecobacter sp.]
MPKITVTDTAQNLTLPNAKIVEFVNTGESTVYYGFEKTITAADDANQGIPLEPGVNKFLSGKEICSRSIRFVCATGESTVIHYTKGA